MYWNMCNLDYYFSYNFMQIFMVLSSSWLSCLNSQENVCGGNWKIMLRVFIYNSRHLYTKFKLYHAKCHEYYKIYLCLVNLLIKTYTTRRYINSPPKTQSQVLSLIKIDHYIFLALSIKMYRNSVNRLQFESL